MSGERYSLGTCRYCGQVVNLERERDSQEAADIAASEECSAMTLGRSGPYAGKSRTRRTGYKRFSGARPRSSAFGLSTRRSLSNS